MQWYLDALRAPRIESIRARHARPVDGLYTLFTARSLLRYLAMLEAQKQPRLRSSRRVRLHVRHGTSLVSSGSVTRTTFHPLVY